MKKAFTLIELSIVLVIIGLVIGGIMAGQAILDQARVRGLIKDLNSLQTAVNTFKIKYSFLPGDFPNAYSIWGNSTTYASAPSGYYAAGCSGNGDWIIDGSAYTGKESFRFWQHLSLAGLINGSYGIAIDTLRTAADTFTTSYNNQTLVGVRGNVIFQSGISASQNWFEIGAWNSGSSLPNKGSITPQDAYGVDVKMDNGFANKGNLYGIAGNNTPGLCSTAGSYFITNTQGSFCRIFLDIK